MTRPPGFENGVTFEKRKFDGLLSTSAPSVIKLSDILDQGSEIDFGSLETRADNQQSKPHTVYFL